jgi:hypothetical protein
MVQVVRQAYKIELVALLCCCITSCTEESSLSEAEKQALTSEIEHTIEQYCKDVRTEGLSAELRYLDHSSGFVWTPPGSASAISYDSVVRIISENASLFRNVNNTYESLHIDLLDDHHASYSALVRSVLTSRRGQVTRLLLEEEGFLVLRSNGWKLERGVTKLARQ